MQIINEVRDKNGAIYFERIYKDDKHNILGKEDIRFPTYTRAQENGFKSIIVYTKDMQPIVEAFIFLNQMNEPYSSRRQAAPALRLLYSYEAIISKKIGEFTAADIEAFKDFLAGVSYSGTDMQFNLIETRDNGTINTYLGIYRKYCEYIGIENAALNQRANRSSRMITAAFADYNAPYRRNEQIVQQREVPMYISPEDFERIIAVIRARYTIREEVIVRLMYEDGLRIGEVFGLTNDDFVEENVKDIGWVNILYLRNRYSDDEVSQSAKGRMRVRSRSDYNRRGYNLIGYGFHKVPISHALADQIGTYIEEAHLAAREKYGEDYWNRMSADRVRESKESEDPNFYIFMNSHGGRLTQQTWNKTMRAIFQLAGIDIDKNKRERNLNHRFRHGFAMRLVNEGMGLLELKEQLRHVSIDSVRCYFRPTTSDIIRVKTLFEDSLTTDIPELTEIAECQD